MSFIKYRPEIDGLRALAVIPVILFHLGFSWMAGGFIGVDVFFVISGFLITLILLKESDQGAFSYKQFFLRRVRRILPAMLTMVITTLTAGYFILNYGGVKAIGKESLAALLAHANFRFMRRATDYWGGAAENSPLLHTWSLSVEEQFYIFFPILLIVLLKYRKQWVVPAISLMVGASLCLFLWGCDHLPAFTFYHLPTRIWELGSGCLLAIILHQQIFQPQKLFSPKQNAVLSTIGIFAVALSFIFISGSSVTPYLIIPVVGATLFIASSTEQDSYVRRFLSLSVVVYIGKISYSLYLWHWPLIVLSKNYYFNREPIYSPVWIIPALIVISMASYHWIEIPTRRSTKAYIPLFSCYAGAIILAVFLTKFSVEQEEPDYFTMTYEGRNFSVLPGNDAKIINDTERVYDPTIEIRKYPAYLNGGIFKDYGKQGKPDVVLFGDSHAVMWASALDKVFAELNTSISYYACEAVTPFFDIPLQKFKATSVMSAEERYGYAEKRIEYLKKWKPELVIICHRWSLLKDIDETNGMMDLLSDLGSKVILIEQPPQLNIWDGSAVSFLVKNNIKPEADKQLYIRALINKSYERGLRMVREIAQKYNHCEILKVADLYAQDDKALVLDGAEVMYLDDDHLSQQGALKAQDRMRETFRRYFPVPFIQLSERMRHDADGHPATRQIR
jgi:peptidoglycan/LPS O-acetylase OafA/YrhL